MWWKPRRRAPILIHKLFWKSRQLVKLPVWEHSDAVVVERTSDLIISIIEEITCCKLVVYSKYWSRSNCTTTRILSVNIFIHLLLSSSSSARGKSFTDVFASKVFALKSIEKRKSLGKESLQFISSLTNSSCDECGRRWKLYRKFLLSHFLIIFETKFKSFRQTMLWHNGQCDWKMLDGEPSDVETVENGRRVGATSQQCRVVINSLLSQFNEKLLKTRTEEDLKSTQHCVNIS